MTLLCGYRENYSYVGYGYCNTSIMTYGYHVHDHWPTSPFSQSPLEHSPVPSKYGGGAGGGGGGGGGVAAFI